MVQDRLIVNKDMLKKIQSRAKEIELITKDKSIAQNAEEIVEIINDIFKDNFTTLLEKIEQKMKEVKHSDPEMNASLYILYRKLVDKKISDENAATLFDVYIKSEPFDRKIY